MTHDNRKSISIRLPEDLHQELTDAAGERGLSVNYLVSSAIQDFLPRLIPADELTLTRDGPPRKTGPHSRACGPTPHFHGPLCSTNCPTCHGEEPNE